MRTIRCGSPGGTVALLAGAGAEAPAKDGMKYFTLVWAGLWRKKVRTILTVLSIVTAFFLFGMLQGINLGIDSISGKITDTTRLRVSNRNDQSGTMPFSYVSRIASVPGVASVTPLIALLGSYQRPSNLVVAIGVDIDAWVKIYPEFKTVPDQVRAMARTRDGALVGAAIAQRYGWKVGDRVPLQSPNMVNSDGSKNWDFVVAGTYDIDQGHDFSTNLLVNYDYVNEARVGAKNTAMQIIVRLNDPKAYTKLAPAIDELFVNSPNQTLTQNEKDYVQSTLSQIGDINFFVNGIVGAVLFTLLFLTANTMMQSVRERIPEIGVLKALGYSDAAMLGLVLTEALLLSLFAAALGLIAASSVFPALMNRIPTGGFEGLRIPTAVYGWGAAVAVLLALASGVPPAWRARRLKIVDALAGR
jgi:putative ABC transport system permease protein